MQRRSSLFRNGELVAKGDEGERACVHWIETIYGSDIIEIHDVTEDPAYQPKEIDFCLSLWSGKSETFEAKSDKKIAAMKNFPFELGRIHHTSHDFPFYLGWSVFSEADKVTFWCPPARSLYVLQTAEFREDMQRYVAEYKQHANVQPVYSDDLRTTVCVFVPMNYVRHKRYFLSGGLWTLDDIDL